MSTTTQKVIIVVVLSLLAVVLSMLIGPFLEPAPAAEPSPPPASLIPPLVIECDEHAGTGDCLSSHAEPVVATPEFTG